MSAACWRHARNPGEDTATLVSSAAPQPGCAALPPPAVGPTCWLLFGYAFYAMPVLRLPLLAYHAWIISPAGRAAVGTSRMPWLARSFPLYWGQLRYFQGSRLVKTAELDPTRSAPPAARLGQHPNLSSLAAVA